MSIITENDSLIPDAKAESYPHIRITQYLKIFTLNRYSVQLK